jgi:Zn-dependent peptidase ImmA (M78 family)/DNA-binding XRE family transcriptional regulator
MGVGKRTNIGERIKMARRMRALSLRELGARVGISATAISKYERGLDIPRSSVLIRLAKALDVRVEFFLRPSIVRIITPAYRCRVSRSKKASHAMLMQVQEWLERYIEVEQLFPDEQIPRFNLPESLNRQIVAEQDVEQVVDELRKTWELGNHPIPNLVELLEDMGVKVGLLEGDEAFDALAFWADNHQPVIVAKRGVPGDRQRFSVAHELAHLILQPTKDVDPERAANHFAGAFLAPRAVVYRELGGRRRQLGLVELHWLKHKYGLSMQGWIYRAKQLEIIPASYAQWLFQEFRKRGWHRCEPGDQLPAEEPQRMKQLVIRALEEGAISEARAAELLGVPLPELWRKEAQSHADLPVHLGR